MLLRSPFYCQKKMRAHPVPPQHFELSFRRVSKKKIVWFFPSPSLCRTRHHVAPAQSGRVWRKDDGEMRPSAFFFFSSCCCVFLPGSLLKIVCDCASLQTAEYLYAGPDCSLKQKLAFVAGSCKVRSFFSGTSFSPSLSRSLLQYQA